MGSSGSAKTSESVVLARESLRYGDRHLGLGLCFAVVDTEEDDNRRLDLEEDMQRQGDVRSRATLPQPGFHVISTSSFRMLPTDSVLRALRVNIKHSQTNAHMDYSRTDVVLQCVTPCYLWGLNHVVRTADCLHCVYARRGITFEFVHGRTRKSKRPNPSVSINPPENELSPTQQRLSRSVDQSNVKRESAEMAVLPPLTCTRLSGNAVTFHIKHYNTVMPSDGVVGQLRKVLNQVD